jgi:hypothetical protein
MPYIRGKATNQKGLSLGVFTGSKIAVDYEETVEVERRSIFPASRSANRLIQNPPCPRQ